MTIFFPPWLIQPYSDLVSSLKYNNAIFSLQLKLVEQVLFYVLLMKLFVLQLLSLLSMLYFIAISPFSYSPVRLSSAMKFFQKWVPTGFYKNNYILLAQGAKFNFGIQLNSSRQLREFSKIQEKY